MSAVISGTNGLLQSYDYQVLTTGFSYTFAAGTQVLVMNPAGTLATGTITMPAAPADGMTITFSSSQQITALTLNGNTGQTVVGAVTFLPAKTGVSYVYRLASTTWFPTVTVPGTGSQLVQGTSVATTSGTSIDFTGIPSWVKRITVMVANLSSSGTSNYLVQLGTASAFVVTGYIGSISRESTTGTTNFSTGFLLSNTVGASTVVSGNMTITNLTGNVWNEVSQVGYSDGTATAQGAGYVNLGATLTRIRLTTVNGTDTFDLGSINILYE